MSRKLGIVIGASAESIYGIQLAQKYNYHVIAFDGTADAKGLQYADEGYVTDIRDASNIITCLGDRVPDIVIPVPIGRWLITSGVVNDFYHLHGIGKKACDLCTDKYMFHLALSKQKLRSAECILVKSEEQKTPEMKQYPIILKPRFGAGSRGVVAINNQEVYNEYMRQNMPFAEDMIVESLISGDEYGIDGAVIDGVVYIVLLRKKIITQFPARQCVGYYSVVPDLDNGKLLNEINQYINKIIFCLEMNNCLFHADLIFNNNEIFVIEISPRPSGHYLHNKFTIDVTGVNMLEEYIKYSLGTNKFNFEASNIKQMLIHYFNFENCTVKNVPDSQYIKNKYPLVEYQCYVQEGHYGPVVEGHGLMERGYFVFKEDSINNLNNMKDKLLEEFEVVKDEK